MEAAASLAGLVSFSLQILKGIGDYYSSYRSATSDIKDLCEEVENITLTLQKLEGAILEAEQQCGNEKALFEQCKCRINELASELQSLSRVSTKYGRRWAKIESTLKRANYPFKEDTLRRLRNKVSTVGEILQQAASTVLIKQGAKIVKRVDELYERVDTAAIFRWLDAPNAAHSQETARSKRISAQTGQWLMKDARFRSWKTAPNSVLWIQAAAGSGKTVLCSAIIDHLTEEHTTLADPTHGIAYFYFDLTNQSTAQDYNRFLRSLVEQLSAYHHQHDDTTLIPSALKDLYKQHLGGTRQPTEASLTETLRTIITEAFPSSCYIVLDAVDEVKDKSKLLGLLDQVVGKWQLPQLHFLLTSRTELDAELPERDWHGAVSIGMQGQLVDDDVGIHVSATLRRGKNEGFGWWGAAQQELVAKSLISKANGNFRWVACQLEELRRCHNRKELRAVLESLPPTLETTYERALLSVGEQGGMDKRRAEAFRHVLQWLCLSARPLHLDEVAAVYAIDSNSSSTTSNHTGSGGKSERRYDPDQHLENAEGFFCRFSSLVTIITITKTRRGNMGEGAAHKELRFAHLSVRDYLLSRTLAGSPASFFAVSQTLGNREVAESCIAYLRYMCCPGACADRAEKTDVTHDYDGSKCCALARYASKYWARHVQAALSDNGGEDGGSDSEKENWGTLSSLCLELLRSDPLSKMIRYYDPDMPWIEHPLVSRTIEDVSSPLYYAALYGLAEPVRLLLKQEDIDVNESGGRYGTALQAAACKGNEAVAEILLQEGADVNQFDGDYGTALIGACSYGHVGSVRLLLEHGADVNAEGVEHCTALHAAAYNGHDAVVRLLLDQPGIDIEAVGLDDGESSRRTPLWEAAAQGHTAVVKTLLAAGANSLALDRGGWTTIDEASTAGYEEIVRVLLEHDKTVLRLGRPGRSGMAIHYAAIQQQLPTVRALLDYGMDVDFQDYRKSTPLLEAIRPGARIELIRHLIDSGADVSHANKDGWQPIHLAALSGLVNVAEVLRTRGVDLDQGPDGWTPLHVAVLGKQPDFVKWLIEQDISTDTVAKGMYTALDCIRLHDTGEVTELLEELGLDECTSWGICIGLRSAAASGQNARIRELLERGADVNAGDEGGTTPLVWAILRGNQSTVKLLLENGADGNALDWSFGGGRQELIEATNISTEEDEAYFETLFAEFGYTWQPPALIPTADVKDGSDSQSAAAAASVGGVGSRKPEDKALVRIKELLSDGDRGA